MSDNRERETLESLQSKELELERLRLLVSPERWPRIYSMLKRIREQIKREEAREKTRHDRAA